MTGATDSLATLALDKFDTYLLNWDAIRFLNVLQYTRLL